MWYENLWWPLSVFVRWCGRRSVLSRLAYEQEVAEAKARILMAPSKVKAEIEWDMKWANPLDKTWRDEILMVIIGIPLVGLWVPGLREWFQQGFDILKAFDPQAPTFYLWSWAAVIITVFGLKGIRGIFQPTRLAGLVSAMGAVRDDVSDNELGDARDSIKDAPEETPMGAGGLDGTSLSKETTSE